jgi:phosphinothricin acetyltransferase
MKKSLNVTIRMAVDRDTPEILEIYAPYILNSTVSFETVLPTPEEFNIRIRHIQKVLPWLVCEFNGKIAGYAYAADHRSRTAYQWTKELSVYVHDQFRKYGTGTALYVTLMELLRMQGVMNCLAGITLPNDASKKFHERLGFRNVGTYRNIGFKFGRFCDVGWWELFIGDSDNTPGEIVPVEEIVNSAGFEKAVRKGISQIKSSAE